jgi:enolase
MIMPLGAETFADALRMGAETFHQLKSILAKDGHVTSVGDEGGFAPNMKSHAEALEYIIRAIEAAGYNPGHEIALAMDCAASEFFDKGKYNLKGEGKILSAAEIVDYYADLVSRFPIVSIRGRHGRGRLGRLGQPVRPHGQRHPAGGRRHLRHQPGHSGRGH